MDLQSIKEQIDKHKYELETFSQSIVKRFIDMRVSFECHNEAVIEKMKEITKNRDQFVKIRINNCEIELKKNHYERLNHLLEECSSLNYNINKILSQVLPEQRFYGKLQEQQMKLNCLIEDIENMVIKDVNDPTAKSEITCRNKLRAEVNNLQVRKQQVSDLIKKRDSLKKQIENQSALIEPFRDQLEQHQMEQEHLMQQKLFTEKELQRLHDKYLQMLGTQNHKEKIKHLIDLKRINYELQEVNKSVYYKIRQQEKLAQKLRTALKQNTPKK